MDLYKNNELGSSGRRNFFVFSGVFLIIIILAGGGYLTWQRYFSEGAQQIAAFNDYQEQMKGAYKNDTYGGATPEETLKFFVEALKKGDVELASKYFALDDNLSREKWVNYLKDMKNKGYLGLMANDISTRAKPDLKNRLSQNDFKFVLYTDDGLVGANIGMEFNIISKVWKIESL